MVVKAKSQQLKQIAALVASGRVKVAIDKVFPLRRTGDAHRYLENGHVRGKVALHTTTRWSVLEPRDIGDDRVRAEQLAILARGELPGVSPFY